MRKQLMTSQEVAEVFGVTAQTVNAWARDGRIPYYDLGPKTRRFLMVDILAHLGKGQVKTKEESDGQAVAEVVD